jgi:biopolymer transport protein ExbD
MKKWLLLLVILMFVTTSYSQKTDTVLPELKSLQEKQNKEVTDRIQEDSYRWISNFQAEQKRKKQRQAIMYLGFGASMLALLIYGLSRRRKKG